jgi:uncharacterized protein (TIGR02118 family)
MVKAIHFIKRKPGLELEAFRAYWLGRHADLVSKVPGVRSYVQSHTLLSGYKKGDPIWDGIAELVYDDIDAMRRVADSAESRAASQDTGNFADLTRGGTLLTEEVVQKDGPINSSMVKMAGFAIRKPGMTPEAFQNIGVKSMVRWRHISRRCAATFSATSGFRLTVMVASRSMTASP